MGVFTLRLWRVLIPFVFAINRLKRLKSMKLGLFVEKPMGRFYHVDNSLYFCIDNQKTENIN